MTYIFIALAAGVLIGWTISARSKTDALEDLVRNIAIGSIGAYVGSRMLISVFDATDPTSFSFGAVVASLLGAAAAVILVNRFRQA